MVVIPADIIIEAPITKAKSSYSLLPRCFPTTSTFILLSSLQKLSSSKMGYNLPKTKIAVIGVGLIGPRHCRTVASSPDARLIAIVDPLPQGAALAKELGMAHYTSIRELLASSDKPEVPLFARRTTLTFLLQLSLWMRGFTSC